MSKQRMVQTTIWTKSQKFIKLNPLERYLFLYLITNERVELCGAYEMMLREMALWTGLDEREVLPNMLGRLEEVGLAAYIDGWVVIPKYLELQNQKNASVKAGVEKSLAELPPHIRQAVDTLSTPCPQSAPDLDSDSDSDIDSDFDSSPPPVPAKAGRGLAPMKDELARHMEDVMLSLHPYENIARERGQIKTLCARCRRRNPENPQEVFDVMVAGLGWLIENGDAFWRRQPMLPSVLSSLWERIEVEMRGMQDQIDESWMGKDAAELMEVARGW